MNIINKLFPEVISIMIHRKVTRSNMSDVMKQLTDIREESFNFIGEDNIYEYIKTYPNEKLSLNDHKEPRNKYNQYIDSDSDYENESDYENDSD